MSQLYSFLQPLRFHTFLFIKNLQMKIKGHEVAKSHHILCVLYTKKLWQGGNIEYSNENGSDGYTSEQVFSCT